MKKSTLLLLLAAALLAPVNLLANTAPTVVIQSATMRPGTALMDVVFRLNDPDDATVKVRVLAFVDGVRSFANVIRPVTFAEGTGSKIGDAIPTNADHTITWDVAADWDVQLGQVKFEVLAMDNRSLLPFEWITIPAAGGKPELTVSKNSPTDGEALDALFWLLADGDPGLRLEGGTLFYKWKVLVDQATVKAAAFSYLFKKLNVDIDENPEEEAFVAEARVQRDSLNVYYAVRRNYSRNDKTILTWLNNAWSALVMPGDEVIKKIINNSWDTYFISESGRIFKNEFGTAELSIFELPEGIIGVRDMSISMAGTFYVSNDGEVSPKYSYVEAFSTSQPDDLSDVIAVASGDRHVIALKSDGTVVGWGSNYSYHDNYYLGQATPPTGLTDVVKIYAGPYYSVALKANGQLVSWGESSSSRPQGTGSYLDISIGEYFSLGVKSDGTLRKWGYTSVAIPTDWTGLSSVSSAGYSHDPIILAVKTDGSVLSFGQTNYSTSNINNAFDVTIAGSGYSAFIILND